MRYPTERLTRAQALKGMTLDAAYASFSEDRIGSITPGKKADFVVLDRDIMTVPFADILDTKVTATVIDGSLSYGSLD
jgi:predicted amidohydrolase YtcJ